MHESKCTLRTMCRSDQPDEPASPLVKRVGGDGGARPSLADPGVAQRKRASWGHQRQLKKQAMAGNALHRAALDREVDAVRSLLANASLNVNERDDNHQTPRTSGCLSNQIFS